MAFVRVGLLLAAGCGEGVETVARKLVRGDVVSQVTAGSALDQQVSDEVAQMILCPGDVLTAMQEHRELGSHEHGRGTLNIAVEGNKVTMELEVPGAGKLEATR